MERILKNIKSFAVASIIIICLYFFLRVLIFSYSDYNILEKFFSVLLLLGETYILIHALGFMLHIFMLGSEKKEPIKKEIIPGEEPSVAIVVAARHEPKDVVEGTIVTFKNLDYPNKSIYFLDDSSEQNYKDEADKIAERHGIKVFRRSERHGAKAGIINDFLKTMTEKYIAIFDADQNPMPHFLKEIIPILEADPKLAFVQTPQFYSNIGENLITKASAMQQSLFFEIICEGKNATGSMFCCGTNVIFRREALLDVGGFEEEFITEDFATSVKLHMKGWRSWYYNHVIAFGMGPQTLPAYFKQQSRWAGGTISVFRKIVFSFLKNPFSLPLIQWWEYFISGTYYFVGWAFFFLMICPIVFLLFNIPSFFLAPEVYLTIYVPYFALTFLIFFVSMKERRYSFIQIYYGTILGSLSFPILMK
ncbi:MAG: glycosyltransferase, partial [Elusimicrobiales bacterium]|nr:glycosyltransferase [Elusimicrobiales bacterium]